MVFTVANHKGWRLYENVCYEHLSHNSLLVIIILVFELQDCGCEALFYMLVELDVHIWDI